MQPSLRTFFRWGGVFKAPSWFDGHLWCGLPPHVPQLTYRSLILIVVVVSLSLAFTSNTRKAMDMSKIQITRFTSALILFIFTGAVFFNSVGATRIPGHHSQCNTGPVQCCQQSFDSNSHEGKNLLAMNNIGLDILSGATGMIGVKCTPITALGAGSGGNW